MSGRPEIKPAEESDEYSCRERTRSLILGRFENMMHRNAISAFGTWFFNEEAKVCSSSTPQLEPGLEQ
jgi:hypothetical protein